MTSDSSGFKLEAIVNVDAKGQIVLPKAVREKAGFKPNGKFALIAFGSEGKVSCILMIEAEQLEGAVAKAINLNL